MADKNELEDDLRPEYDFSQLRQRGERGKYAERFTTGTTWFGSRQTLQLSFVPTRLSTALSDR